MEPEPRAIGFAARLMRRGASNAGYGDVSLMSRTTAGLPTITATNETWLTAFAQERPHA